MKTFRMLLLSSRPLSWVNTAYPFAAAYLLTAREIDLAWVIGTLYFLVPYNLAMYGINDVFDYESDLRNPRKGGVEGAVLDRTMHAITLRAAIGTNVPFLVALVILGSPLSWLVLAISIFAVVADSAPGLRFKERPFLDSATSSTHFVSPALWEAGIYCRADDRGDPVIQLSPPLTIGQAEFDDIEQRLRGVLTEAWKRL